MPLEISRRRIHDPEHFPAAPLIHSRQFIPAGSCLALARENSSLRTVTLDLSLDTLKLNGFKIIITGTRSDAALLRAHAASTPVKFATVGLQELRILGA